MNRSGPPKKEENSSIAPNNEETQGILGWNKLRKSIRTLPASSLRISNPNKESDCYRIIIRQLEGLSYQPKARETKRLAVKFNLTFYSNALKQFFGRSVQTNAYFLRPAQEGYGYQFDQLSPLRLFFHTQVEKSSATIIVIEAYLLEVGAQDIVLSTVPFGISEINIVNLVETPQTLQFRAGSMRQYLSPTTSSNAEQKTNNSTGLRVQFTLENYPELEEIKNLFPESIMVSSSDNIPGLLEPWADSKFYSNEQSETILMKTLPLFKVFLTQARITFSENVEREFVKQVQQFLDVSKSQNNKVIFKDRKLVCGFHNGWGYVNRGGSNNFVILKQGPRRQVPPSGGAQDDQATNLVTLEYNGMHEIDNVFDASGSVVVLQLEYDIEYIAQARQIATRIIAWLPVSLQGKLATQKEFLVTETMAHGPGKSLNGQRMVSLPHRPDFDIQIVANFTVAPPGMNQISLYQEVQRLKQIQTEQQAGFQQQKQQQFMQQNNNYPQQKNAQIQQQQQYQAAPVQPRLPYQQGQLGQPNILPGMDPQQMLMANQIQAQKQRLEELQQQAMINHQQQMQPNINAANIYQFNEYQMINWEPRNDQERQLLFLQTQAAKMKEQVLQQQREKDQIQLNLTNEFRMMREEVAKQRQVVQKAGAVPKLRADNRQKNNYGQYQDDDDDEDLIVEEGREANLNFNNNSKITYSGQDKKTQQLIVHFNQPSYGNRQLSKKDRINLINLNVPGLLDNVPSAATKEQLLDEKKLLASDLADPLKASVISFRILSFKPNSFSGLPKRMYMTTNFFDFSKYQTESFTYEASEERAQISEMIAKELPIVLMREAFLKGEEERYLVFKFEVDPSKSKYADLLLDFSRYLLRKSLHVDIWDADTLMFYGSFKIPLHQLRRSGMNRKTAQFDLDIVNMNNQGLRGSIQIHIDNIGKMEANPNKRKKLESQDNEDLNQTNAVNQAKNVNTWQNKATAKAKVVSDKSISIPQNFLQNQKTTVNPTGRDDKLKQINQGIREEDAARKMERIKRFKNTALNKAALIFEEENQESAFQKNPQLNLEFDKIKELSQMRIDQIEIIKNKKKPELVKQVISKFLNEEKILSLFYGKQEVLPFVVQNTTDSIQTYSIVIEDPDEQILNAPEFEPISDPAEWKYWINVLGCPPPSSFDILQGSTLVLEPQEKVTILFKTITYRAIDPQLKDKQDVEKIVSQRDSSYRQQYINPRSVNVFVCLMGKNVVGGFRLRIEPHQQVIDHVFRYYEREGKSLCITLPPLYLNDSAPSLKPTLHVTNSLVQVEWVSDIEISFFAKMPQISKILKFNVLVYNSDFRSTLLANIQVELHALDYNDMRVNMGQTTTFKLNVPGDIPRVIRLFSSVPEVLWFNAPYNSQFTLPPGKITQVESNVKSLATTGQKIQINAVDVNSHQLIHSWIISVETDMPTPSKLIELTAIACKESIQIFNYLNRSQKTKNYSFLSSDSSILQILDASKQILGSSDEEIAVKIIEREYSQPEATVIVFVSDYEETIFDTLKFRIRYIFNEEAQSLQAFYALKKKKDAMLVSQQEQQNADIQEQFNDQHNNLDYQDGMYGQQQYGYDGNNNRNYDNNQNNNYQGYQQGQQQQQYQQQYQQQQNNNYNNNGYNNNRNNYNQGNNGRDITNNNYNNRNDYGQINNNNYGNNNNNYAQDRQRDQKKVTFDEGYPRQQQQQDYAAYGNNKNNQNNNNNNYRRQ